MGGIVRKRVWDGKQSGGGSGGSGGSNVYNGQRAITRNTPGIQGFNPNSTTITAFLEGVFYPAVAPAASISVNSPIREVGASGAYTLTWNAIKNTNNISSINVDGTAVTPTGATQGGSQSGTLASTVGTTTKTINVSDGTLSGSASCTVTFQYRKFWGTTSKTGLSGAPILDSDILGLANNALATSRNLSLSNFGGGAQYLIFAWPSSFGVPQFIVNGLNNTAFSLVRSASPFVNSQGATVIMDVWVSNSLYNSPLSSLTVQ